MVTLPAWTVLLADGEEVAFESPAFAVPFALGVECELASPPVVLPLVLELLFALDPPSEESLPDAVALLAPPLVLPVADEFALEPEPLTSAAPVAVGEASALERPVVALLVPDIVTLVVPPLALSVLDVLCVCVALEPPCDPPPPPDGDPFAVLLPPLALPLAIGLIWMLTCPPDRVLVAEGDEVAAELPTWAEPLAWA